MNNIYNVKMDKEKVLELIDVYEKIIHGDESKQGLFDCYDTYYSGCWVKDLEKVEELKKEMVKNNK